MFSIAIVNIKKSNGVTQTSYNNLDLYLENDKTRLRKQRDLINPNIVLCGSVFSYYKAFYEGEKFIKIEETNKCYIHNGRLIIDFWHFANREKKKDVFEELASILFEGKVFDKLNI